MTGSPRILDNGLELSAVDELAEHLAPNFSEPGHQETIAKSSFPEPTTKSPSPAGAQASEFPQAQPNAPTIAPEVAVTRKSKRTSHRAHSSKQPKASRGLFDLASRRWRLIATAVAVLFVGGLGVRNWQKPVPASKEEQADLDLADFSDDFSITSSTSLGTARSDSSDPSQVVWEGIADRETRQLELDLPSRELPSGRVQPVGHSVAASERSTNNNVSNSGMHGPRGAWLTGQIEFESNRPPFVDQSSKLTTTNRSR